jgi:choline dehydrogenase
VRMRAHATRVLFDGKRATGVEYRRGDALSIVAARREVIVSSGSINSPKLLKLSGVGPAAELAAHGIPLVHDLPGVGENLQDHIEFYFQVACTQPVTLYSSMGLFARARIGARWILCKDGLGATNHFETGAFIRSHPDVPYPDIQFHFLPLAVTYDGSSLANEHGFQAHVGPMRSKSRGHVRLSSRDARVKPKILFNYLSHEDDRVEFRAGLRAARKVFAQRAFDPYRGREIQPGKDVQSDDEIDAFVRAKVESAYHPSCSNRMGARSDPMAVVDPAGRVHGLESLRVIDSSIMPSITTGNLNAPTIMLAEKLADHIRGRPLLPAAGAGYHVAREWRTSQR